jgi:signal peptidase I
MGKRKNGSDARKDRRPGKGGSGESVRTIVYALVIALFIRTFLVQAFRIPSGSMEDTLLIGDFLLVDKVTFGARVPGTHWRLPGLRKPRRGDIIVFKDPRTDRDFIKRCIGQGDETLDVVANEVYIDGKPLDEPYKHIGPNGGFDLSYFPYRGAARQQLFPWVAAERARAGERPDEPPHGYHVPAGEIFMMGDNRNNSQDSRVWGPLTPDRVVGRAFVLYWSTDPDRAPQWVRNLPENWVKGFFQLFLGRPRITRVGRWLATNYTETYEKGWAAARPADAPE